MTQLEVVGAFEILWDGSHQDCDADLFDDALIIRHKSLGNVSDEQRKQRAFDSRAEVLKVLTRSMPEGATIKAIAQRAKVSHTTAFEVLRTFQRQGRITREPSVIGGAREYVYRLVEGAHGD